MRSACARLLVILVGIIMFGAARPVQAAAPQGVDVALVLAADVSRSIDDGEFNLQRRGYAAAITSPKVLAAIAAGAHGAIAVCYVEWSGADEQITIAKWMVIRDGESAASFADILTHAPRAFTGRTSISGGIDYAMQELARSGVKADRRVIDISGDGTNNAGRDVTEARDAAVGAGVTINGLAIINKRPAGFYFAHTDPPGGLPNYYQTHVVGGSGAFVKVVKDFDSFGDAVTNKLLSEIAAVAPPRRAVLR